MQRLACFLSAWLGGAASAQSLPPAEAFIADWNARVAALPERAWYLYADAQAILPELGIHFRDIREMDPDDAGWPAVVEVINESGLVELAHRIGAIPELGAPLDGAVDPEWRRRAGFEPEPGDDWDGLLTDIDLPSLGVQRALVYTLRVDALQSARAGDFGQFVHDVESMMTISSHGFEGVAELSHLVGTANQTIILELVRDVIRDTRLDASTLDALASIVRRVQHTSLDSSCFLLDQLGIRQIASRAYDDDGHIVDGAGDLLVDIMALLNDGVGPKPRAGAAASAFAKIERSIEQLDDVVDVARAQSATPIWTWRSWRADALVESYARAAEQSGVDRLAILFMPDTRLAGVGCARLRMDRDATLTVIAIERCQRAHESYPDSLDDLVGEFLDEVALDWSTGEPLIYRAEEETYVLYSRGPDRDDDGGVALEREVDWQRWYAPGEVEAAQRGDVDAPAIPDGDWVIWRGGG